MRADVLALISLGLTVAVIGNAWVQRQQFYPSVVYITKSNPSMAVIYIQFLVGVLIAGKIMRKIFFGQLRAAEFEHLMERSWYAVTETCLAFTVFKDDFSPRFVSLFVLLLFLKSFHWLAEERVDFMERSPIITFLFHLRVLSLCLFLASLDFIFVQIAYNSTVVKGASVQLVFGLEYAILLTIVTNTMIKYVLHSVDLRRDTPWENKEVFMLYTELFIGLIKVLLYALFFVIMVRIYTLPLFAVRPLYLTMRAFKKAFNDVLLSRRAIHVMNTLYPDATSQELANADNVCIICREEMQAPTAKKLPCNHIFHKNCLRSWFQRQQTCPTCRLDILQQPLPTGAAAQAQQQAAQPQAQQPAGNVNFNNNPAIALLRQQIEALQHHHQRQQQPAAGIAAAAAGNQQQAPASPQQQPAAGAGVVPPGRVPAPAGGIPQAMPAGAAATAPLAGATGGVGARPGVSSFRLPPPPFPFMPWAVPPPMPPPNFQGLSDAELQQMEGNERQNVEARIKCLRNIQVLLDAAVLEMQQYSSVVARCNATSTGVPTTTQTSTAEETSTSSTRSTTASTTSTTATSTTVATSATTSATKTVVSSTVLTNGGGNDVKSQTTDNIDAKNTTTPSVAKTEAFSSQEQLNSVGSSGTVSAVDSALTVRTSVSSSNTGARPKTGSLKAATDSSSTSWVSNSGEKEKSSSSSATSMAESPAAALDGMPENDDQEEVRRRCLEVFAEHRRRLMKK